MWGEEHRDDCWRTALSSFPGSGGAGSQDEQTGWRQLAHSHFKMLLGIQGVRKAAAAIDLETQFCETSRFRWSPKPQIRERMWGEMENWLNPAAGAQQI